MYYNPSGELDFLDEKTEKAELNWGNTKTVRAYDEHLYSVRGL